MGRGTGTFVRGLGVLAATAAAGAAQCERAPLVDGGGAAGDRFGTALAAAGPRLLVGAPSGAVGLLFYGVSGPAAVPLLGGTPCVRRPLARTPVQDSGGGPPGTCAGAFAFDFAARVASGADPALAPGVRVDAPYGFADRGHPDGSGVGLSDALRLDLCL